MFILKPLCEHLSSKEKNISIIITFVFYILYFRYFIFKFSEYIKYYIKKKSNGTPCWLSKCFALISNIFRVLEKANKATTINLSKHQNTERISSQHFDMLLLAQRLNHKQQIFKKKILWNLYYIVYYKLSIP